MTTHHLRIAFDVDDTLVIPAVASGAGIEVPNYDVINLYRFFERQGHHMIIWSGGGQSYAAMWAEKLGLRADEIIMKTTDRKDEIDLAFDDSDIELAKVNVKVKRINNHIQRYPKGERFIDKEKAAP
jgi:hypothetical protein